MARQMTSSGVVKRAFLAVLLAAGAPAAGEVGQAAEALFQERVLPALTEHCFRCHGPETQKAGLRLDSLAAMLEGGVTGAVLVPGDIEGSRMALAVSYEDHDLRMPPDGPLPPDSIKAIHAWIAAGAPWTGVSLSDARAEAERRRSARLTESEAYWGFRPVRRPEPPAPSDPAWAANPIDAFVASKLDEMGLRPSPKANRGTLIRRVFLDVLGLPPTPEEVAAFVADDRKEAYAELIDRVLASPHYGERWARHWLDVVRFAETNGFETNTPRNNAWPYRDYVIRALNEDKPYTVFIAEQLAGDVLGAEAATGFLVGGPWDEVKSPDIVLTKNQRDAELHDMVNTTGAAFLGLTVGCAKCHNHKFDPISQQDYYAMRANFEGVQHGERELRPPDYEERRAAAARLQERIQQITAELGRYLPRADTETFFIDDDPELSGPQDAHEAVRLVSPDGTTETGNNAEMGLPLPNNRYSFWTNAAGKDLVAWQTGREGAYRLWLSWGHGFHTNARDAQYYLDLDGDPLTQGDQRLIAEINQQLPATGSGPTRDRPLWSGFRDAGEIALKPESRILLRGGSRADQTVTADVIALTPVDRSDAPALRPPVHPKLNQERFAPIRARWVRFTVFETSGGEPCIDELEVYDAATGENVALASAGAMASASSEFPNAAIHKIAHLNDGLHGNDHSWISAEARAGWAQIELPRATEIDHVLWGRDRTGGYKDRLALRYRIDVAEQPGQWTTVATSNDRAPRLRSDRIDDEERFERLSDSERRAAERRAEEKKRLEEDRRALLDVPRIYAGTYQEPGPTHLLHRGDPMMERDVVAPGGLAEVAPAFRLPPDTPERERRLALARWIGSRENPFTARVAVNRIWHYHFGRGLAATPSDFGAMGVRPTHPELLDWLASEFMDHGWRMKPIHRLILMSRTYRQSSAPRLEAEDVDADTLFLWRFPPRRLEAEPIRDSILAVSGALDLSMGGPGYQVFEPNDNYVRVYTPKQEFGPAEWRRMVYQFKPRMQQDATFGAFDCPDAAQSMPRRNISTTPLQALNLLNSPFLIQQSELLAARLVREAGSDPGAQIERAFRLALNRPPTREELGAARTFAEEYGLPLFCRALYNTNEFLYLN